MTTLPLHVRGWATKVDGKLQEKGRDRRRRGEEEKREKKEKKEGFAVGRR